MSLVALNIIQIMLVLALLMKDYLRNGYGKIF